MCAPADTWLSTERPPVNSARDVVLEIRALTRRFGERTAVDGVHLRVESGTIYGLLGRNGAGKTTLLRMILGLLTPDAGTVTILGREAPAGDVATRAAVAGFVEEPRFYPYLSARRNLELLARLDAGADRLSPDLVLDLVDLADRRNEKFGNFSTGMRQRLGIAAALLRSPKVMVLDEPTMGLDPANAQATRSLLQNLAERGVAVLLSSHNMAEVAEICDRVSIIHEGRTVWLGTQADLRAAAPAPTYRVWTTDDARAASVADTLAVEAGPSRRRGPDGSGVFIRGTDGQRDVFVLELAAQGIAVRRLEPDVPPLDALFSALTTGQPAQNENGEDAA
jgi:ABC-2 type transport system ATP-binding protein